MQASATTSRASEATYTASGRIANRRPPIAGPATTPIWFAIERSAIALPSSIDGTSSGVIARAAGEPTASAAPLRNASTRYGQSACSDGDGDGEQAPR